MGEFSIFHWLVVLAIALLIFGPSKFASLGKALGEGIRNFKSGIKDSEQKKEEPVEEKKP
jgi:sec-independent protein translocase protein TatA